MRKNHKGLAKLSRGFTLVEIIVVMVILAILGSGVILYVNPLELSKKTRDHQRKHDLQQMKLMLELFKQDHGHYPYDHWHCVGGHPYEGTRYFAFAEKDVCIPANSGYVPRFMGQAWPPYVNKIPHDPQARQKDGAAANDIRYQYRTFDEASGYCVYAYLERGGKDKESCNNGNRCTSLNDLNPRLVHCGWTDARPCNYGVCSQGYKP